jgi:hypothetical protein
MIGSLLYLTVTRPNIQFALCLCARFQASPRSSHRTTVQRIFRYLKYTLEFGIFLVFPMLILRVVGLTERHFWCIPFSWIFPCLLASSQTVIYHTIHHRGRVCSSYYLLLLDPLDSADHKRLWSDLQECSPHV